ncbi:MAG TPA: hypothetical protein VFA03_05800 [Acetobacteraceae bacterium]|nr:hypothetical protein [Acetobacteraceae bacterium]
MRGRAPPVKRSIASLVGGIAIALGCLILWLLVAFELAGGFPGWAAIAGGLAFALVVGAWVRLADL